MIEKAEVCPTCGADTPVWVYDFQTCRKCGDKPITEVKTMNGDGNVIHLAFENPNLDVGRLSLLACKECRNKTYTLTFDGQNTFPLLRCAACGNNAGRMGWYHDEEDKDNG